MTRMKFAPSIGILCAFAVLQATEGTPSIDLILNVLTTTNGSAESTTPNPSISERIHASISNVLRLPLPLLGVSVIGDGNSSSGIPLPHEAVVAAVVQPLTGAINELSQNQQSQQQPGVADSQNAPPVSFLPDVNQAIQTIAQLSTLSHWPFAYETTARSSNGETPISVRTQEELPTTAKPPTAAPTTVATTRATTPAPTQSLPVLPPQPLPPFVLPVTQSQSTSILPAPQGSPSTQSPSSPPSLPDRIHNRIHSTLGNLRLPILSQLTNPRPRPMLTEPPWVTELLGPTLEPPTTRMPTLGERVHNAINNVILFVPATLLNFWYENWGTQHVDRIIQRLPTPQPGSPVQPVFATISQGSVNPFANLTAEQLRDPAALPAIAAFVNSNGTLTPTIVHPVFNMTANTIQYQLRSENETTVLWTGMLSNDVFFGNKKTPSEQALALEMESEDDEDEQIRKVLNIRVRH